MNRAVVFRVEVRISGRWILIEGAGALSQPEAHRLQAAEAEKAGAHRVRTIPVHPQRKAPK